LKAVLIVNSIAAKLQRKSWQPALKLLESSESLACDIVETECQGHAVSLAEQAVKRGSDLIVAVGGDGTINECVNGMMFAGNRSKMPLFGIIPLGSGSDFIRTIGIPREPMAAAHHLRKMNKKRIDVGQVRYSNLSGEKVQRFFVNVADVGLGGMVVKHAARAPRMFGRRPNYLWGMISGLIKYRAQNVALRSDGHASKSIRVRNVVFANGKYFGRGFKVAPNAEIDDGIFDVISLGDFSTAESIWHLPKMYSGTHLGLRKVEGFRTASVEIDSNEQVLLELDGELAGTLPASFEVVPGALEIIC
jgi:diacylglycerol kinase (ATP)